METTPFALRTASISAASESSAVLKCREISTRTSRIESESAGIASSAEEFTARIEGRSPLFVEARVGTSRSHAPARTRIARIPRGDIGEMLRTCVVDTGLTSKLLVGLLPVVAISDRECICDEEVALVRTCSVWIAASSYPARRRTGGRSRTVIAASADRASAARPTAAAHRRSRGDPASRR